MVLIAAFNWLIDPYGVFRAPVIDGVNRIKYGFNNHLRLAKAYALKISRPATVILGSSRAEASYDPAHPAFRQGPIYNLAISGASMYELFRYLQHAEAVHPLKEVVVALDFYMFNSDWKPPADFDENRLAVSASGKRNPYFAHEAFALLLSGDALSDSWWSLRHQSVPGVTYFANGLRDERFDIPGILAAGGHRRAFMANEEYFAGYGYSPRKRGYVVSDPRELRPAEWLRRLLAVCRDNGASVHLVMNPVHTRQHQLIADLGLRPQFEDWKRELVRIVGEDAAQHHTAPYELRDFAVIDAITAEEVPAPGDSQTRMRWYRESSHFTKALGDRVLERVLTGSGAQESFGRLLTPKNIEAHLRDDGARMALWRESHAEDVAEVARAVRRSRAGS